MRRFGELPALGLAKKLADDHRPDIVTLRLLLDPTASCATLSGQSGLGGGIMLRLAAVTAAAYETFIAEGATAEEATRAVYEIAGAVYRKMGCAAWELSAVAGRKNADRRRIATVAFRTFRSARQRTRP